MGSSASPRLEDWAVDVECEVESGDADIYKLIVDDTTSSYQASLRADDRNVGVGGGAVSKDIPHDVSIPAVMPPTVGLNVAGNRRVCTLSYAGAPHFEDTPACRAASCAEAKPFLDKGATGRVWKPAAWCPTLRNNGRDNATTDVPTTSPVPRVAPEPEGEGVVDVREGTAGVELGGRPVRASAGVHAKALPSSGEALSVRPTVGEGATGTVWKPSLRHQPGVRTGRVWKGLEAIAKMD